MMTFTKFLLIGTLFAAANSSAFASTLNTGSLDINGTFKVVGSGPSSGLDFLNNPTNSSNGVGLLATLNGTNNVTFSSSFTFSGIHPVSGELLFAITKGVSTVDFYVTSYSYSATTLTFTGYVIDNNGQSAPATFVEQYSASTGNTYSYTGELILTPEPSSILLMGTGLLAVCGMMSLKRRRAVNATMAI